MTTDKTKGDVDFTLQKVLEERKKDNQLKELRKRVDTIAENRAELSLAQLKLKECINQLEILQKNLEVYSKKAITIVANLEKLEGTLFEDDK